MLIRINLGEKVVVHLYVSFVLFFGLRLSAGLWRLERGACARGGHHGRDLVWPGGMA